MDREEARAEDDRRLQRYVRGYVAHVRGRQPLDSIVPGLSMRAEKGWSGRTYKLYSGALGNYHDVIVKKTPYADSPLVQRDIKFSQILAHTGRAQRLLTVEKGANHLFLAVEEYQLGVDEILKDWNEEARRFDIPQLLRGILKAVQAVHTMRILHGDLRTKNIGITVRDGEIVCCWRLNIDFNSVGFCFR